VADNRSRSTGEKTYAILDATKASSLGITEGRS
jgi:hypothetical protein